MNKTFLTTIIKFCFLSLLSCQTALAFNKAGDLTLTAGGGYDYFATKRQIDNTGIPFGIIGYNFSDNWGIEALLGFFHTTAHYTGFYGKDVSGTMFAADVVYHFTPYKFVQPYLLAGPGIMGLNPNDNDANNEGNVNGAAGVQLFFNDNIAFRLEARDIYTIVGGKNDVMLSGGITFLIAI